VYDIVANLRRMRGMGTEITHLDYVSRGGCTVLLSLSNYSPLSNSENT